jgi:hypothetical protein
MKPAPHPVQLRDQAFELAREDLDHAEPPLVGLARSGVNGASV